MPGPFIYTDSKGREWDVKITLGTSVRLEEEGLQFHKLAEENCAGFFKLQQNDGAFAAILWAVVRLQAANKQPPVTRDDFLDSVTDGETFYKAWEVFAAAYANFTRDPQMRSALHDAQERQSRMRGRAADLLKKKSAQFEEAQKKFMESEDARMTPEAMERMIRNHAAKVKAEVGLEEESPVSQTSGTQVSGPSDSSGNSPVSSSSAQTSSSP